MCDITAKQLAAAIEAAYSQLGSDRVKIRFYGRPPMGEEPSDMEAFAAEVLRYLPMAVPA